ncbi:MAG: reverse transcriptase N-terminal domain-containing protein [Promethearchaeota archaeon]
MLDNVFLLNIKQTNRTENFVYGQNWRKIKSQVLRLQNRISRATKEKRWGMVRSLQFLFEYSK